MMHPLRATLALAALALSPALAQAATPTELPDLDQQIECAVVFAMVAGMQDRKDPEFERFPAMDKPGQAFFYATLDRIESERGLKQPQAIALIKETGAQVVGSIWKSDKPMAMVESRMNACLPLFEIVAPDAAPQR